MKSTRNDLPVHSRPLPLERVRRVWRRTRLTPLCWSLAAMLASVGAKEAERIGWWRFGTLASLGLAALSGVILWRWIRWEKAITQQSVARRLDADWELKSRLESTLELAADHSALARSQREEAAGQIAVKSDPPRKRWLWYSAIGVAALITLILLVEFAYERWEISHLRSHAIEKTSQSAKAPDNVTQRQNTPPSERKTDASSTKKDTFAEFQWLSPVSEYKAAALEEVALRALATTRSGIKNVVLDVSVNGEKRLAKPVPSGLAESLAVPGEHEIGLPLALDELAVKEFDLVSYFLRGETSGQTGELVKSPLQFIQIRGVGMEASRSNGSDELVGAFFQLKTGQLRVLKGNFVLANSPLAHSEAAWKEANAELAREQARLGDKAADVRRLASEKAAPARLVEDLSQVTPLMKEAADKMRAEANAEAVPLQEKVLALFADAERLFVTSKAASDTPQPTNPFREKEESTASSRGETAAGKLESLEKKQSEALTRVGQEAAGADKGEKAGAQSAQGGVATAAQELANRNALNDRSQASLKIASREAAEAARRLELGDPQAALSPAASAAEALRQAVLEQERAGRALSRSTLEAQRRELNRVSRLGDASERRAQLTAMADTLVRAAQEQQETGSAEAARQLSVSAEALRKAIPANPGGESWLEATRQLATAQAVLTPRREAIAHSLRQSQRGRNALLLGNDESGDGELELVGQLGWALLITPADKQTAADVATLAARDFGQTTARAQLEPLAGQLEKALEALVENSRDERVKRFNPDEIDPLYRPSVESYFERLSREGSRP